jgi:hypothetical protein
MLYGPNAANRTIVSSWQNITIELVAIVIVTVDENKDHNSYYVLSSIHTQANTIINDHKHGLHYSC